MVGIFNINGQRIEIEFGSDEKLLDVLRKAGFKEIKSGCKTGNCGSCVVLLDGKPVNSCQVYAGSVIEKEILTIKGLGTIHNPHPIQTAFVDAGAVQCGFCTPGMVLSTYALLKKYPRPTEEQIKEGLDGNLCRCTGYVKIVDAVKLSAERVGKEG